MQKHTQTPACGQSFDIKANQSHFPDPAVMRAIYDQTVGKKTMWCHQITAEGKMGTTAAAAAGITHFQTSDDIWQFLGKDSCRCLNRFRGSIFNSTITCKAGLKANDHDNTCTAETCLWLQSGLPCPKPTWAVKS